MDIDEAGRKRKPLAEDAFVRIAIGEVPDCNDSTVGDRDVGGVRRSAASVKDARALEDRPEQRLT
jgi:hypothetical protein